MSSEKKKKKEKRRKNQKGEREKGDEINRRTRS